MSDAVWGVIGSIITGILILLGTIYQSRKSNDALFAKLDKQSEISDARLDAKLEKYQAVTDTKIDELTREVRSHNGHGEKIALLEAEDKRLNERIKVLESKTA